MIGFFIPVAFPEGLDEPIQQAVIAGNSLNPLPELLSQALL
jgi:hypothetical protein